MTTTKEKAIYQLGRTRSNLYVNLILVVFNIGAFSVAHNAVSVIAGFFSLGMVIMNIMHLKSLSKDFDLVESELKS